MKQTNQKPEHRSLRWSYHLSPLNCLNFLPLAASGTTTMLWMYIWLLSICLSPCLGSMTSRYYQALIDSHVRYTLSSNSARHAGCTRASSLQLSSEAANEREALHDLLHADLARTKRHAHSKPPLGMCVHLTGERSPLLLKPAYLTGLPRTNFTVALWVKPEGGQRNNSILVGQ